MCSGEEYEKWKNGKVLFWKWADKFVVKDDIIEELKNARYRYNNELKYPDVNWEDEDEVNDILSDEGIKTYEEFFDNYYFETFKDSYKTPNGEDVVAFGYYGYDG
jgi:hypothetical protein